MNLQYLNYKEPLKPVENGHGFLGTLAQTQDGELVQCHICGGLHENLGVHIYFKHGIKARDYRIKYQLGLRTPLCSDKFTERCKERMLNVWSKMSTEEQEERRRLMAEARDKTVRVGRPRSLEALNKDGMCPDQLLKTIQQLADKLGHSPSFQEFKEAYGGKYIGAINRTFGTWNGAKEVAGLVSCKSGAKVPHNKATYTNKELLTFLKVAYKEKGTIPTYSDWKKGFLPSYYLYKHRFGGINKARQLAGIN